MGIPGFYIDVPYEKNQEAIQYVAGQLREMKRFLEEMTGKMISEEAVQAAVSNSKKAAANYQQQLALRKTHDPSTTLTRSSCTLIFQRVDLLSGSETAVKYTQMLLDDVKKGSATVRRAACSLDAHHAVSAGTG